MEIHDQLISTIRSDQFADSIRKLPEAQAHALGAVVMQIVNGQPITLPQEQVGPRVLSEQEFLALTPQQLAKLEKYEAYVDRKMEKAADRQQAAGMASEMAAASARLDQMREQQSQYNKDRREWMNKILERVGHGK